MFCTFASHACRSKASKLRANFGPSHSGDWVTCSRIAARIRASSSKRLAHWAASYLNERLVGLGLGARMLHQRLHDPSLSSTEAQFLEAVAPSLVRHKRSADFATDQTRVRGGVPRRLDR